MTQKASRDSRIAKFAFGSQDNFTVKQEISGRWLKDFFCWLTVHSTGGIVTSSTKATCIRLV